MSNHAETANKSADRSTCLLCVWAVHQGDDDRSSGKLKWFFDTEQEAKDVAAGRGWYGGNAPVSKRDAIRVGDIIYLLASTEPLALNVGPEDVAELRAKALAKLTSTERKLLGISDT